MYLPGVFLLRETPTLGTYYSLSAGMYYMISADVQFLLVVLLPQVCPAIMPLCLLVHYCAPFIRRI